MRQSVTEAQVSELTNPNLHDELTQSQAETGQTQQQSIRPSTLAHYGFHEFMDKLQIELGHIHAPITATYFPTSM